MKPLSHAGWKTLHILLHLTGWMLFVYLTFPHFNRAERFHDTSFLSWFAILNCSFLVAYFYLNAGIFVPQFLSRRKITLFLGISVGAYLLFCFVIPFLYRHYTEPPFHPEMLQRRLTFPPPENGMTPSSLFNPDILFRYLGIRTHSSQFLVIFIISTGMKAISQWYAEKQRLQELENSMIQAELSFLKSQIHPHFLFNCLNSIYYLALSRNDRAPEAILSLSDFLRFVTTESNHSRIPMEKEIKMLEEYIHLQSLRASEKFELKFHLSGDFRRRTVMPLIFVPFVENAFKYGISAHTNCFIHISVILENDRLTFTCDNSIIPSLKDSYSSTGVGLENIRKRLELAYAGCHHLDIRTDSRAFRVKLLIDMK
jgi:hypothetical protein